MDGWLVVLLFLVLHLLTENNMMRMPNKYALYFLCMFFFSAEKGGLSPANTSTPATLIIAAISMNEL